ncbi:hypothetical protein EKD04_023535 [Chloroflexales bacterium ZM16-3]|nr:hypothetical protein [Chloroflexales bacterium ZM16-3]
MIALHGSRPSDELFHFHPRSTNPELWRTTVPLVVRVRCQRHKGLIATWTAIHWLIVLHAASGRAHFGMREIAEEAGVGRNELAGPGGHIQRLVNLGLIRIVGYKSFRGLREPRPLYHVDLAELERLSLDLVPEVLRDHQIDRPPPIAPDPRQLRLALVPTDDDSAADRDEPVLQRPAHLGGRDGHENGTAEPLPVGMNRGTLPEKPGAAHENGTEGWRSTSDNGASMHEIGTVTHENGTALPRQRPVPPGNQPGMHENGTVHARNRDIEGEKERKNEGESQTLTPDLLQSLITQATQAVLATLQAQGGVALTDLPASLSMIPLAPDDAEPLSASVLSLWQGDQQTPRQRDLHQLALLAAEYDRPTDGHGAYWLGRAILMADLCLSDRDQPITIVYVRRMLRRWREEGSWGSDREAAVLPLPPQRGAHEAPPLTRPAAEPLPAEAQRHPAVRAYVEALHETPNAVQAAQIAETVSDLNAWRQVLTDWQLNGWGERSVGKMLDRYQKSASPGGGVDVPPSVALIHTYPGISPEQRDRWIRKFHAAATPAEKRAVLARLEQEHPR